MSHLEIEYRFVDELNPYENNSRKHSVEQIAQIANSIREFGFLQPVVIDENDVVITGHGRIEAVKELSSEELHELGLGSGIPTIKADNLTEAQKRAYIIADNKLSDNSEWDLELLSTEIIELQELQFDTELLGFDSLELISITNNDDMLFEESELGEQPKEKPKSKTDDGFVEFSIVMSADNKDTLIKAINHAKKQLGHESSEYALMEVVRVYAKNS